MSNVYADLLLKGFGYGFVIGIVFYFAVWGLTIGIRLFKQIF